MDVSGDSSSPAPPAVAVDAAEVLDIGERIMALICDGVAKKPETQAEALALAEYVYHAQIVPLFPRLRTWALSHLPEADRGAAAPVVEAVEVIAEEVARSGCCGGGTPRKTK